MEVSLPHSSQTSGSGQVVGTRLVPGGVKESRHQELPQSVQHSWSHAVSRVPWTGQGTTRAARGLGPEEAQVVRARAAGRARAGRRSPPRARRRGWRWPPSGASAPAGERSRRAPGRGRRVARGPGAPGRLGSPRGSCRRALRTESGVRRGVERGARATEPGRGGAGSLTGRCRRAGGRRQLLQEAHGHFQDVRFLQLREAGALRPATKERDRERDKQDRPPAGCREYRAPRSWCRACRSPRWVGSAEPVLPGLSLGPRALSPHRLLRQGYLGPPGLLAPRPGTPYPQPQCARPVPERPGTHLPAQQRQDEALELAQALVDARAAALLQQWLQALQAGAKAAVTRVAVQAPAPAALPPDARPRLLPCAAPPGPLPSEAAPCSAGKRRRCGARAWETCARPDTERRPRPAERSAARPERAPVERAPRPQPGFKEAARPLRPVPPRGVRPPVGPTSAFVPARGWGGRGDSGGPGFLLQAFESHLLRARGALLPEHLQGCVWAPSKPSLP